MSELTGLSARKAVELLAKGEVSPLEMIDAAEERIAEVDGTINALPTLCLDRAREKARELMANRPDNPPYYYLHGLPIAIKDLDDVAGVRTTYGSPIYADHVPEVSDQMVQKLEANGAVVIGKSNTPEFGAGSNTFNEVFGATVTPWDTTRTCGGSSGGSAAALASGQVWLASGSDLGGSLRIPASYCSVVGLRPTPGRVASGPSNLPFQTMSVKGPMGRDVGDAALMLEAMLGGHPVDPLSRCRPVWSYLDAVNRPMIPKRIGYSPDLGIAPLDPEVREVCDKAAKAWQRLGIRVEESCPDMTNAVEVFQILRASAFAHSKAALLDTHRDLLKPEIIWNIEKGLKLTMEQLGWAERERAALYHRTVNWFNDYDLLMCPTVMAPPFDVNIRWLEEVNGTKFDSYVGWLALTMVLTLTACPVISIPCGFTKSGLPVGIQIMAPPHREEHAISAAAIFETEIGPAGSTPIDPRG